MYWCTQAPLVAGQACRICCCVLQSIVPFANMCVFVKQLHNSVYIYTHYIHIIYIKREMFFETTNSTLNSEQFNQPVESCPELSS